MIKESFYKFHSWEVLPRGLVFIDSVKDYTLRTFPKTESFVRIPSIYFINDLRKELTPDITTIDEVKDNLYVAFEKIYKNLANGGNRYQIQIDYGGVIVKKTNGKLDFETIINANNTLDIFVDRMIQENIFDINLLISRFYYEDNFIIDFNKRALDYAREAFVDSGYENYRKGLYKKMTQPDGENESYNDHKEEMDKDLIIFKDLNNTSWLNVDKYRSESHYFKTQGKDNEVKIENIKMAKEFINDNEKMFNYENYIAPVLSRDNIIHLDLNEIARVAGLDEAEINDDIPEEIYYRDYSILARLYEEEIADLMDPNSKSQKMKEFERLLGKYFLDKEIYIYPSGIKVSKKQHTVGNKNNSLLNQNFERNIDISNLSSGERKLLMILALSVFANGQPMILDEPELSLSIVWQEGLLPDILNIVKGEVFVATHSPYIVSDDSLEQYLIFLPQED